MKKSKIGITTGDLNGIGLEVVLKTLSDSRILSLLTPVIFGSGKILSLYKKLLHLPELKLKSIDNFTDISHKSINVFECVNLTPKITFGKKSLESASFSFQSLEACAKALQENNIDAMVTAPIDKQSISEAIGAPFVGQTEFLEKFSSSKGPLMSFICERLKVALNSNHIAVEKIAEMTKKDTILRNIQALETSLRRDFKILRPKIAVLGLNPHASDNGLLGTEEANEIIPAIQASKKEGTIVEGPYPTDSFFANGTYKVFDATLCMYHDQGLTPFKILAEKEGVNFTAGLDFVRTSPVHGVGYEIAGKKCADTTSFRAALFSAVEIYKRRGDFL